MQRGSSFRLSGKILVLECVCNLLNHNDPDRGLELETLIRNATYIRTAKTRHPVDLFVDPLTPAKVPQILVYICSRLMCLLVKSYLTIIVEPHCCLS